MEIFNLKYTIVSPSEKCTVLLIEGKLTKVILLRLITSKKKNSLLIWTHQNRIYLCAKYKFLKIFMATCIGRHT